MGNNLEQLVSVTLFTIYLCRNNKMSKAKRFRPAPTVEQIQTDILTKVCIS